MNLRKLKVMVMKEYPFFGALLHTVKWIESKALPTAGINQANEIYINPDYFDTLTFDEQMAGACHEILHGCLMHVPRIMKYGTEEDKRLANHAADYLINFMLQDAGLKLHKNWLFNQEYTPDKYTVETLVDHLRKIGYDKHKCKTIQISAPGSHDGEALGGGDDVIQGGGEPLSPSEQRVQERERKMQIASAMNIAKRQGRMPGSIERYCKEILQPQQNWKEELREWFNTKIKDEISWNRPARRFVAHGRYVPTRYSEGCGHIGIAVDVSGSISEQELSVFSSELNHIFEICKPSNITVAYFDTSIQKVEVYDELPIKLKTVGGGGTEFPVAFRYFNENCSDITGLIFMTDMYGQWPKEPNYPVCVLSTTPKLVAPFGRTLYADIKGRS